jgi:hypothetical protein
MLQTYPVTGYNVTVKIKNIVRKVVAHSDNNEDRYTDILRRIEGRRQQSSCAPGQADLSSILDGLNALGFLDDIRRKNPRTISLYGPKAIRGQLKAEDKTRAWVGAVAWYKPRGYHHYRTLTVLGVWAIEADACTRIVIGTKPLEFDSPVFNPESYYRHIKRGFDLYYRGDGSPPPPHQLYAAQYDAGERLATRETIQAVLVSWVAGLKAES